MVAARHSIFTSRVYDHGIEYIESTGTQYIDTGVPQGNNTVTCVYQQLRYVRDAIVFGIYYMGSGEHCDFLNYFPSQTSFNIGQGAGYGSISIPNYASHYGEHDHVAVLSRRDGLTLDGVFLGAVSGNVNFTSDAPYYIFMRSAGWPGTRNPAMRLKAFSIRSNVSGEMLFDAHPVRKDGEGYLFDRVHGSLYGNAGDGSFVLGPDSRRERVTV